jgi:hypothetical protein
MVTQTCYRRGGDPHRYPTITSTSTPMGSRPTSFDGKSHTTDHRLQHQHST